MLLPILAVLGTSIVIETNNAITRTQDVLNNEPPYTITDGPLVSVVIITYNEEKYLPTTLLALSHQTYQNFEIIVSDNMSTDNTVRIAESYGAKVVYNPDYNLSKSRNMGADVSSGEIILFLDADTFPEAVGIEKVVEKILQGYYIVHFNHCSSDSYLQSLYRVAFGSVRPNNALSGGCFGVLKEAFYYSGKFNETWLAQEGNNEDIEFIHRFMRTFPDKLFVLEDVYNATSARRQKKEGYIVPQHFQERSIRKNVL